MIDTRNESTADGIKLNIHTALIDRIRLEKVFLLELRRLISREGAKRRSKAAGPIVKTDCSKRRVKSKSERQPWTTGPKALS